jgi:two-component system response regulator FixJ
MTGLDLLRQLRKRQVSAPAILTTRRPSRSLRGRAAVAEARVVEKPLLGEALTDSVRAAPEMPGPA